MPEVLEIGMWDTSTIYVRFTFIDAKKADFPITVLCRALEVSESGYHAWRKRPESKRAQQNRLLEAHIKAVFLKSRKTYGSPRIKAELDANGTPIGRHRAARIMKKASLWARMPKRFRKTTDSRHCGPIAPNIVERRFEEVGSAPNRLWVSDLTYLRTGQGWMYLCVFIDVFSRKVVGWSIDGTMEARMVKDALFMALKRRNPDEGLIIHTDRGSQYASDCYRKILESRGIKPSMSRKGNCWDNAMAESFFASLKGDLIDRKLWPTRSSVEAAVKEYIENFYNGERRHSALNYTCPIDYEALTREAQAA